MQYVKFGPTGLTVSNLCIGTATFGNQTDERQSCQILDMAAEAGINFIDTANVYPMGADWSLAGVTEEITGRWLKGRRDRFILATKAGVRTGPSHWDGGASRKHLLSAIDASLRRLGTDYVDLYQVHFDDPETPLEETVSALDAIVRAGKARYVGVCNFLAYRLARAVGKAVALGFTRIASVQPRYNLLFREFERELLPLAREENLAVIPFNPLAGGLLSGRYSQTQIPNEGRFSAEIGHFGSAYRERYWHQAKFDTVKKLGDIATARGEPLTKISVGWVLANPAITSVILGASRPDQLTDTLAAGDFNMSADFKAELDALTAAFRIGDAVR